MTAPTTLPAGPPALGFELSADAQRSSDGWLTRELVVPLGLDGPPGILQGGLAAGITGAVARAGDRFGAPWTAIDARLHAPTPLGCSLAARVRPTVAAARYDVELRDGDTLLVSAEVELAGHDPSPRAFDLLELATVPVPPPEPQDAFPTCWVCGSAPVHPHAQRLHPRHVGHDAISIPWVADEVLGDGDGVIDPLVVSAVLDCPTVWASIEHVRSLGHTGALLAGYHLRVFSDARVMEPLRTVARLDDADGRKVRARGGLVDEDGVLYAVASAFHVSVAAVPSLAPA
jgi:hypothetical protein